MRMYPLSNPRPAVFVFEDEATALVAAGEIDDALAARNLYVVASWVGPCVVLPAPYEVRREHLGRTLRGDEYEEYVTACAEAATFMAPVSIRIRIEEMHVFDWDAFKPAHWAVLNALYPTLPGWVAASDLPRWFGSDEQTGPYLWLSVEPPGLQLGAVAEQASLDDWRQRFAEGTRSLPIRDMSAD